MTFTMASSIDAANLKYLQIIYEKSFFFGVQEIIKTESKVTEALEVLP